MDKYLKVNSFEFFLCFHRCFECITKFSIERAYHKITENEIMTDDTVIFWVVLSSTTRWESTCLEPRRRAFSCWRLQPGDRWTQCRPFPLEVAKPVRVIQPQCLETKAASPWHWRLQPQRNSFEGRVCHPFTTVWALLSQEKWLAESQKQKSFRE